MCFHELWADMAPLTRVGQLLQVTEVIQTAASFAVRKLVEVASTAASKRIAEMPAVRITLARSSAIGSPRFAASKGVSDAL
jgi:hypothetical protein